MEPQDMIKNRDIIIVGQQPWDIEIGSNCKNLAIEFSKHNRVLYINSPLDRITLLKRKHEPQIQKRIAVIKGKEEGLIAIDHNLWNYYPEAMIESINWLRGAWLHTILNKYNNRVFARSIKKAAKRLGFKNYILFNDNDIFRCFYLKELLKPAVSIYYSRDFMLGVDYWKRHGLRLEPKLIAKSDVCVANSVYLANYCKKYNPQSFYVGQGCDLSIFTSHNDENLPVDVAQIKKPVIGYVGALQSLRLDIDLLEFLAKQKPDWSIVLVGPEDGEFQKSDLHQLPNVHFLGSKDPSLLPAYIASFDVCINPQIVNEVTIGNYPRKIDEYLAMGKPTVATRTEAMSVFEDYVYLGESHEDYLRLIARALAEDSTEKQQARIAFASTHTWENNAKSIYEAVNHVANEAAAATA
ncbi:glycosyltransferase [Mucilaginibacter sp. RS28]|uniref:Glycosyltransferase n=1 Tax=Mucilaginibacter straminoryzae TaxID=2932774 RepID=A0A9X1X641_9SPHI|nr:glycosyltransferase [Mucilaginibacter straminoryzae]MCJ8211827.1 glycosyltransferase [Mucilaginibacter straminoryzae]